MTPYEPYDLLSVTSPAGNVTRGQSTRTARPVLEPVAVVHRIELTEDGWWRGVPPEPGNAVIVDTGAADFLDYVHYEQIADMVGGCARVLVVGSGEAAASVARCLDQYRSQEAT